MPFSYCGAKANSFQLRMSFRRHVCWYRGLCRANVIVLVIQGLLHDSNSMLFNLLPGPGTARSGMDGTSKAINQLVRRGSDVLQPKRKGGRAIVDQYLRIPILGWLQYSTVSSLDISLNNGLQQGGESKDKGDELTMKSLNQKAWQSMWETTHNTSQRRLEFGICLLSGNVASILAYNQTPQASKTSNPHAILLKDIQVSNRTPESRREA